MPDHRDDHQQHHHGADHGDQDGDDHDDLAALLELDAQVFADYWAGALDAVCAAAGSPHRVLDLGAGTGTGALALAARLPAATVVAVDTDPQMLQRIRRAAEQKGLGTRVTTERADLDVEWPDVGSVDLTWASMSLHHLVEPAAALAHLYRVTTPGGIVAIAEFDDPVVLLPDHVGDGLERRCLDRASAHRHDELPHLGSAWPHLLGAAGFDVIVERTFALHLDAPYPPGTGDYARGWLDRLRQGTSDSLDDADRATFHELLDNGGLDDLVTRGGLDVRGERTLVIGRR